MILTRETDLPSAAVELMHIAKQAFHDGDCIIAWMSLTVDTHQDLKGWQENPEVGFLIRNKGFADLVPELGALEVDRVESEFYETPESDLLEGIAQVLEGGGYRGLRQSPAVVRPVVGRYLEAFAGDSVGKLRVFTSHAPWSTWFGAVVWDRSWCIFDTQQLRVSVVFFTDSD